MSVDNLSGNSLENASWKPPVTEREVTPQPVGAHSEKVVPYYDKPEERTLFTEAIPPQDRVYVGGKKMVRQAGEKNSQITQFFSPEALKNMTEQFQVGKEGTILFVDSKGEPWITAESEDRIRALKIAGYKETTLTGRIPLSKGEDFGNFGGTDDVRLSSVQDGARAAQLRKRIASF